METPITIAAKTNNPNKDDVDITVAEDIVILVYLCNYNTNIFFIVIQTIE